MANFSPSNLVAAQAVLQQRFNEPEMRKRQSAASIIGLRNTDALIPNAAALRTREDRPVSAYILKKQTESVASGRVAEHTGNRGDSFDQLLTWSTYARTFSISAKQLDNNMFDFNTALANQMMSAAIDIHEAIETAMIAYLVAERTQVNAATAGGSFSAANNTWEIAAADEPFYVQRIKSMMRQNKYNGVYDAIFDPLTYMSAERYINQGTANATNTAFQFAGLNAVESVELADSNYAKGISLVMPAGTFGMLPWIPKQNRQGYGDSINNEVGMLMATPDPLGTGMDFAVSAYTKRADASSANGSAQDFVIQFEMSVDIAPIIAPLSTANASVVFQVGQLS